VLAERVYEGLFLFDSNKYSRNPKDVSGQVHQAIEKCGGEVIVSRLWSEQKLAYPINGQRKGTYWLVHFRMDSLRREELNRAFRLNTNVLRELILVVDERLVTALVEHASGTVADKAPPAEVSPKKSGDGAAAKPEAKETAVAAAEPEVKEATVAADDPGAKEAAKVE
jgi:small subunit ribosomal protein S6